MELCDFQFDFAADLFVIGVVANDKITVRKIEWYVHFQTIIRGDSNIHHLGVPDMIFSIQLSCYTWLNYWTISSQYQE